MAAILSYVGDFRAEAMQAAAEGNPNASRCERIEPIDPAARAIRRHLAYANVGGLAVAVLGLAAIPGGIVLESPALFLLGLGVFFLAVIAVVGEAMMRNGRVRRLVVRRCGAEQVPRGAPCVSIEDARTFSQLKTAPEDMGLLWIEPDAGTLILEGLSHRYRIQGADVMRISKRWALCITAVTIAYRINGVELELTLAENQINIFEVMRQIIGMRPRILPIIERALGPAGERTRARAT